MVASTSPEGRRVLILAVDNTPKGAEIADREVGLFCRPDRHI